MERSKILKYGDLLARTVFLMLAIVMALFTAGLIVWLINPESFSSIRIVNPAGAGFNIGTFKSGTEEGIALSELTSGMILWLYFRGIFLAGIGLLIARKVLAILSSIEQLKTFYSGNIEHFRDLARIGFIAFLFSCVNVGYIEGVINLNFTLAVGPLMFSVASLVLSEVFREGKHLLEENEMIV
jgi:hypothetical protein